MEVPNEANNPLALIPVVSSSHKNEDRHDQIVNQILEVGQMIGLIDTSKKEQAASHISEKLSDETL